MTDAALIGLESMHEDEWSGEFDESAQDNDSSTSDPYFLPVNAAKLTQSLIGLSDEQRQVLSKKNLIKLTKILFWSFASIRTGKAKLLSQQFVTRSQRLE
ncbi:hypothetical protein P3T76_001666 [Phytophthora citrophthora]|uniref:Uncharacterized protein n=1 Tax=Phytophthora citrophthora TaxID=4793 RepID=A0AAD9H128_9STRA|nr:hypothetical protein P3T76_001666 [Phytophthora citrophthora]